MAVLIVRKAAAPAGGEGSFTMTAGDFFGALIGYAAGLAVGSIDAQPIPGFVLTACYRSPPSSGQVSFEGDATSALAGLTVWVDGVEYPFDEDWAYDGGENATFGIWNTTAPNFVNAGSYFVEIK